MTSTAVPDAPAHGPGRFCLRCGTPYTPNKPWQRYDSTECRRAYGGSRKGAVRVVIPSRRDRIAAAAAALKEAGA